MKDYPQNTEQWAKEAYQSLESAWVILTHNNPMPSEKQKEKLIEIAATISCNNRDIKDASHIAHAKKSVVDEFMIDYNSRELIHKINFSLCFILAYFDAHLSLSIIKKEDAQDAINYLKSNYDLSSDFINKGQNQANVFSISYSNKS